MDLCLPLKEESIGYQVVTAKVASQTIAGYLGVNLAWLGRSNILGAQTKHSTLAPDNSLFFHYLSKWLVKLS